MKLKSFILLLLVLNSSLFSYDLYYIDIEKDETTYYDDTYVDDYTVCRYNSDIGKFIYSSKTAAPYYGTLLGNAIDNVCPLTHNDNQLNYANSTFVSTSTSYLTTGICEKYGTSFGMKLSHRDQHTIYKCPYIKPICEAPEVWNEDTYQCEVPPLECTENELLNENNECVPLDSLFPEDFPNDDDGTNGKTTTGSIPTTLEGCNEMERYNSSLGIVEVLGWDYQTETCKVVAFKCNQGRVLDHNTNKCIIPPDNAKLGGGDICPNDNWARRWTHDFCGDCVGTVGVWFPPLGHEESGMKCNKAYIEYQCVKDYRIKKYMEVSCGDPIPHESETNHIDMDNLNPSQTVDTNVSNLPAIDPTQANLSTVENLRAIESAIKDNLSPKIDTVNQNLVNTNDKLSNISNQIGDSNSKLNGIKSSLDNINDTLNTTGDGINLSDMDLDDSGLDDTKSIMDNFADNVSELTSGITSIEEKFTETK
ncbi:MAG: hypothetical protein M0Q24_04470, partial [Sulfurimonas sp.]|uniref:hypothetical protein n=1 Tax=Sulfurimonas sp. TaxID=2022749 RepID=UPI0025F42325